MQFERTARRLGGSLPLGRRIAVGIGKILITRDLTQHA